MPLQGKVKPTFLRPAFSDITQEFSNKTNNESEIYTSRYVPNLI